MIFCGSLSFAGLPSGRNFAKKCHDTPEKRADGAQEQPERGKHAVDRMRDRKRFPVAHNTGHLPTDLIRAERPFDFGLIVPDQIKAIGSRSRLLRAVQWRRYTYGNSVLKKR